MSFNSNPLRTDATNLAEEIYKLTEYSPRKEDDGVTSQLRRSARSIPENIAAGEAGINAFDRKNFYYLSRGAVTETLNHLTESLREGDISKDSAKELEAKLKLLYNDINKIILSLKKC